MSNKNWQIGTLIKKDMAAVNVMSLTFSLPNFETPMAGQHYDIRLTAPDGYQAERSYSIASAPEEKGIVQYGIELLPGGEVSSYLSALAVGKQVEMRGPIGGHFTWSTDMPGPLIMIAGGSGMVPFMSMIRHHLGKPKDIGREIIFLISARTIEHVLWKEELAEMEKTDLNIRIIFTLTNAEPDGWTGYSRRIDQEMLKEIFMTEQKTPKSAGIQNKMSAVPPAL